MRWLLFTFAAITMIVATRAQSAAPKSEPPAALEKGLVAYWNFDDADDVNATQDQVGKNHLSLIGAGRVAGISGGGLFFDGSITYAKLDAAQQSGPLPARKADPLESFTVATWVRLNAAEHRHPIVTKEGNLTRGFMLTIERDGQLAAHFYCDKFDSKTTVKTRSRVPNITWTHVAVTFDVPNGSSAEVKMYIDGKLDGSRDNVLLPLAANDRPLEIGRIAWSQAYVRHMLGRIDELRIYNRALSEDEMAMLAKKPD